MELDAALEPNAPSAEEVLRRRMAKQARKQHEADLVRAEANRVREEQEKETCDRLREEIASECRAALARLATAGYPNGGLMAVVTRYKPTRTWFGQRYYRCYTTERACWELSVRDNAAGTVVLASDGELYKDGANPDGYRDKHRRIWRGLHQADLTRLQSWRLQALLEGLKHLPKS